MKSTLKYLPLLLLFLFSCKDEDLQPELPPATQTGERTFGAYVNGGVWVPKGRPSTFRSNFSLTYEPGYRGGTVNIRAYRITSDDPEVKGYIQIGSSHIGSEGIYPLNDSEISLIVFRDSECYYNTTEDEVYREGTLEITRLDMEAGVISGKFEFSLAMTGCDTIHVTEGRFDYKLF